MSSPASALPSTLGATASAGLAGFPNSFGPATALLEHHMVPTVASELGLNPGRLRARLAKKRLSGDTPLKSEPTLSVEGPLKQAGVEFSRFRWAPSGRALYFEGVSNAVRNLWKVAVDPQTLQWTAGPDRLTNRRRLGHGHRALSGRKAAGVHHTPVVGNQSSPTAAVSLERLFGGQPSDELCWSRLAPLNPMDSIQPKVRSHRGAEGQRRSPRGPRRK